MLSNDIIYIIHFLVVVIIIFTCKILCCFEEVNALRDV